MCFHSGCMLLVVDTYHASLKHTRLELGAVAAAALTMSGHLFGNLPMATFPVTTFSARAKRLLTNCFHFDFVLALRQPCHWIRILIAHCMVSELWPQLPWQAYSSVFFFIAILYFLMHIGYCLPFIVVTRAQCYGPGAFHHNASPFQLRHESLGPLLHTTNG